MVCAEYISLREAHQVAAQIFVRPSATWSYLLTNSVADSDFNLAHRRIRAARRACEMARDALEHHQTEHGCC